MLAMFTLLPMEEVESIVAECVRFASDDEALRARYARLYEGEAGVRRPTGITQGAAS
jgi:hypothetical protein